jgi:hypothetical protein
MTSMRAPVEAPLDPHAREVTLAVCADGGTVVEVISDGGRSHVFQYRDSGLVVAEATTLHGLARQLAQDVMPLGRPRRFASPPRPAGPRRAHAGRPR